MTFSSLLNYLLYTTLCFTTFNQSNTTDHTEPAVTDDYCASHHLHEAALQANPALQQQTAQMEAAWKAHVENQSAQESVTPTAYILPVVFHIIHQNGAENIPDATVLQALQDMNDAFANTGYYDQGTGVDTEIQFCLAKQDPDGNPTTGINRVVSPLTEFFIETQDIDMKDLSRWEPTEYINIWLVKEICSVSVGCGVAGYAYFPSSHGNPEDGIVVEAEWAGSSQANSSVLAHEMGHYLGLYHTFQDGCGNDDCLADGDRVCDTPPDQTTVPVPCNLNVNSCNTDVNLSDPNNPFSTDQDDMFWNYMDYGDWNCYSAFTAGQDERMDFFIEGARASLLDSEACIDACPNPIFLAVTPCDSIIDIGETIDFINTTTGATSFEWTVNGTLEATTTNFSYTFNVGGAYSVLLTAFNGDSTCIESKNLVVIAIDCEGSAHVSDGLGNDVPGCGAPGSPCQTIQYALDNVVCSGDTVFIHSGVYQLPAGEPVTTPIARIPENYTVTFYGVEDNGPVIIDGNNNHRGFQYNYVNGNCPDSAPDDGIDVSHALNFANLNIRNVYLAAFNCATTNQVVGGGIQIYNNIGSSIDVSIRNCIFEDNFLEDPISLNNNGRSVSGAAVYLHGLVNNQNSPTTAATLLIDSCSFSNNKCYQLDNGGHGGAVCVIATNTATITNSSFCNNETFSENADQGDMDHDRNAGGAILFNDTYTQSPGHELLIDHCSFIGNFVNSADGATFTNQSEGGAVFLTRGDGLNNSTSATLTIGHSQFYDNNNELGIEHIDNNSGTIDLNSIGFNQFADNLEFDFPDDTTLCSGTTLFAPVFIAGATYEWSTGETGPSIEVTSTGSYAVTVTAGQCEYSDDILVIIENCSVACEDTYFETMGTIDLDEGGTGMIPSGDGNFYVAAYQEADVMLIKMTPDGEEIWSRTMDFTNEPAERIYDMIIDADGYLIACGSGGIATADQTGFVFKYDPDNNNLLWSNEINAEIRAFKLLETSPTANYLLAGLKWSAPAPGQDDDAYLISIDRNTGDLSADVNKAYYTTGTSESFVDMIIYNNSLYGVGRYVPTGTFAGIRPSVSRLDFSGNEIWSRLYMKSLNEFGRLYNSSILIDQDSIVLTQNGDYNSGGSFATEEIYLSKADIDGNAIWTKSFFFDGFDEMYPSEALAVDDGYLILAFNRVAEFRTFLLKTTKNGDLVWSKQFVTPNENSLVLPGYHNQLVVDNDRIYVIGQDLDAAGLGDILIAKLTLEGELLTPCPFIEDAEVVQTNLNAFDTDVDLFEYPSPLIVTTTNKSVDSTDLTVSLSCIGSCIEICDNGIDDDGDDLIDLFDPDCPCYDSIACNQPFYNVCADDCNVPPLVDSFTMASVWNNPGVRLFNEQAVGDIDGDCIPDIVAVAQGSNTVVVLNSLDGSVKYAAPLLGVGNYSHIAIGDVDLDGMAEIFVNRVVAAGASGDRWDYNPGTNNLEQTWFSSQPLISSTASIPSTSLSPALADFNYDGIAEVYYGNNILSSLNGNFLAFDPQNNQGTYSLGTSNFMTSVSVAADVLADSDCADCAGLELVAGNQVYSVNLDAMTMTVERELPGQGDGAVRLVDFDRDGDLDAVVTSMQSSTSGATLYVWDLQTETLIGNVATVIPNGPGGERIGAVSIGDVDADGWPEIIVATRSNFTILEDYQNGGTVNWGTDPATLKATISTTDTSGGTGSTIYDFNGDGKSEIVYRDETLLRVFDENLNVVAEAPCTSGTATEYPIIADIDGDDATELLCGCTGTGLNAFESENTPWVKSRKVWNQYSYFAVNVNDDGRIPTQQQKHHIVGDSVILNNFLQQQPIYDESGQVAFPTADWAVITDSLLCNEDSIGLLICNFGTNALSEETPVAIYDSNPTTTAATLIGVYPLGQNLPQDSCITWRFINPDMEGVWLYAVVNDDGSMPTPFDIPADFPVTDFVECDYTNNLDSFVIGPVVPVLDLGPDTTICDNGQLVLNAGSGFDSYEWHDGSTDSVFTAYGAGEYWVEVTTYCGPQRDTINLTIDIPTIIELPDSVGLCGEPCVELSVTDWYDTYEWFPTDGLDCPTCPTTLACPTEPTTYIVLGSSFSGCFSIDTVTVVPVEPEEAVLDTLICLDDVVEIGGVELGIGETDTFFFPGPLGCENSLVVNVGWNGGEDTYVIFDGAACEGDTAIIGGVEIPAGQTVINNYVSYLGCDSTVEYTALALPVYDFTEMETICNGDSLLIFGNYETQAGTYSMTFTSGEDCDSTINIVLDVLPAIEVNTAITNTCVGEANGAIAATASGGSGGAYTYEWSTGENTATINNLGVGDYGLTVTDVDGCTEEFTVTVDGIDLQATATTTDLTCNGAIDGTIEIENPLPGWTFALDGGTPQTSPLFDNLPAGNYEVEVIGATGCTDVLVVTLNEPPALEIDLIEEVQITLGETYQINASVNIPPPYTISWSPTDFLSCTDCLDPVVSGDLTSTIDYTLTVSAAGNPDCSDVATIRITPIINCAEVYELPNAFTPDADGTNDYFKVIQEGLRDIISFEIYNRWGEKVFEANGLDAEWDGTIKGKPAPSDVYIYMIRIECPDLEEELLQGEVSLIR